MSALLCSEAAAQAPRDGGGKDKVLPSPPVPAGEAKPGKTGKADEKEKGLLVSGRLERTSPLDRDPRRVLKGDYHAKTFPFKMIAGRRYVIDLMSDDFDAYLRLLDAGGTELAFNDDITPGVNQNARIDFRATRTETYRIVATTFSPGSVGSFTVRVTPLGSGSAGIPPPPPPRRFGLPGGPLPGVIPPRVIGNRVTFGDITVTAQHPLVPGNLGNDDTHGYVEYRLTVRNESAAAHRVAVRIPRVPSAGGMGNYLRSLRRAIDVPPKSTAALSLFQPDLPFHYGNEAEVAIDGQVQRDPLFLNVQGNRGRAMSGLHWGGPRAGGPGGQVGAYVLAPAELVGALNGNAYKSVLGDPRAAPGVPRSGVFGSRSFIEQGKAWFYPIDHAFVAGPEPKTWECERWLGFSGFDGVALRADDLEALPATTRAALWRYVECGGGLLLVGAARVPDAWKRGAGRVEGLTAYYPGFGQCLMAEDTDLSKWSPARWRAVLAMWEQSAQPWQHVRSANDANANFPVVEDRAIPVRGLFVAMLVFAVLVGPVNVHLLTRRKQRIWLLWTVPVFSMLTCLAVFGFMLLSEGWTGHVRVEGVTVLDESSQRAVSLASLGVYSPITPGDGLHFGYDTEVTPQLRTDPRRVYRHRERAGRTVDWTRDQHLESGWVSALVPAHFLTRANDQRLERLVVRREPDGSLKAVNGLKAPVVSLWLADTAGTTHTADNVPPGKEVTLKASALRAEGKADSLRAAFAGDWLTRSKGLQARPEGVLRPGTYLAVLDGAPFLERGLRGAHLRPGRSVVFGILKEIPGDAR